MFYKINPLEINEQVLDIILCFTQILRLRNEYIKTYSWKCSHNENKNYSHCLFSGQMSTSFSVTNLLLRFFLLLFCLFIDYYIIFNFYFQMHKLIVWKRFSGFLEERLTFKNYLAN